MSVCAECMNFAVFGALHSILYSFMIFRFQYMNLCNLERMILKAELQII